MKTAVLLVAALALCVGGCATKRYGRAVALTDAEAASYTCRELDIEISKAQALQQTVAGDNPIDGAAVLGYLGDFGIGNAMERRAAMQSAEARLSQLRMLKVQKSCPASSL